VQAVSSGIGTQAPKFKAEAVCSELLHRDGLSAKSLRFLLLFLTYLPFEYSKIPFNIIPGDRILRSRGFTNIDQAVDIFRHVSVCTEKIRTLTLLVSLYEMSVLGPQAAKF
jgi:hypothetical protein